MFAETATKDISQEKNLKVAQSGGEVAKIARDAFEKRTGKSVITSKNAAGHSTVVTNLIEGIAKDAGDGE